jgi:hypothetical protein
MARPKSEPVAKKRSSKFFDPRKDLRNDLIGQEMRTPNYGSRPAKISYGKLVIRK